jgi:putative hemolysin
MKLTRRAPRPFDLEPLPANLTGVLAALVRDPLENLLCLRQLNDAYSAITSAGPPPDFAQAFLEHLNVAVQVPDEDLKRIPPTGPLVVVANHPFGGVEGLAMSSVVRTVRSDFKMLANHLLARIPEARANCIFVDPFGGPEATQRNLRGLKEAIAWLRGGGVLGVFPAGTVAHFDFAKRQISESPWSDKIIGLVRRSGAAVLPMYFSGSNGPMFQMAGLIHPRLRTALLPRELINKRRGVCKVQIGPPIGRDEIADFPTNERAIEYLRLRTQTLADREARRPIASRPLIPGLPKFAVRMQPLAPPVPRLQLEREIARLPASALLAQSGDLSVYQAHAEEIPYLLTETGRLREVSFRGVGEGTGKTVDLDRFDRWYVHLLLWNHQRGELAGGYRLGLIDQILRGRKRRGLYMSTLFQMSPVLFEGLGPAIELGRSFVRPEYQKSFSALTLLWKAIGQFIAREPQYRYLVGPVSISSRYRPLSRALMVSFLSQPERLSPWARFVRPRHPFNLKKAAGQDVLGRVDLLQTADALNRLVADVEPDGKGMPILLKQYLKMGARALAFNVDKTFGHCLDCLCLFDMLDGDERSLRRYLGEAELERLRTYHLAGAT